MPHTDPAKAKACRDSYWSRNRAALNALQRERRRDPAVRAQRAEAARRHRDANPDLYRDRSYRSKYGITLEDYERMWAAQDGRCAICRDPDTGSAERPHLRLHVDHNHATGKVRGLLCRRCNVAVGYLEHADRVRMSAALNYIKDRA